MGIEQLVDMYKGNPGPLDEKVKKAQQGKAPGEIPEDLEEAIALQKIANLQTGAKNQQAIQAGGAQPSIVEKLRQMLAANQRQQAQPPQMPQGAPQGMPQGQPQMAQGQPPQGQPPMQGQPVMAARGGSIAQLMSNLGRHYAGGGIVAFVEGGDTMSASSLRDQELANQAAELAAKERNAEAKAAKVAELQKKANEFQYSAPELVPAINAQIRELTSSVSAQKPSPTDPNFRRLPDPRYTGTVSSASPEAQLNTRAPAAPRPSADRAPMPGGLTDLMKLPSVGVGTEYQRRMLAENQQFDPEAYKAKFLKEVGSKDLSVYDEMAEELKARKERLKNPEPGFDSLMEYLGQIAQGGGRNWMESGARGAAGVKALQKSRQDQQDVLVDKILDLGSKKKEAVYNEKLGLFNLTKTEKDRIDKESREIAGKLSLSEDNEAKLKQDMAIEMMRIKAQKEIQSMPGSEQRFFNQMANSWLAQPANKGKTMFDAYTAFKLAGAPAAANKGIMTRAQATDDVRALLENPMVGNKLMKEAGEALKATGVSNPSTLDITEYLIQKQMNPSFTGSASSATVPPLPAGYKPD